MTNDDAMLREQVERQAEAMSEWVSARQTLREYEGMTLREIKPSREDKAEIVAARSTLGLAPLCIDIDITDDLDDLGGMFDDALEVFAEGRTDGQGEWDVQRVCVLLSFGGPNIWLRWDGNSAWLDGYWGGSKLEGFPVGADVEGAIEAELDHVWDSASEVSR